MKSINVPPIKQEFLDAAVISVHTKSAAFIAIIMPMTYCNILNDVTLYRHLDNLYKMCNAPSGKKNTVAVKHHVAEIHFNRNSLILTKRSRALEFP